VSNFQIDHLERLVDQAQVVPAVNQIELHTQLQQEPLRRFHTAATTTRATARRTLPSPIQALTHRQPARGSG
jgi:hypothetical protein